MGFRDETQALRARIESLEGELSSTRDDLEALEADRLEIDSLRVRVAELESELAEYAPKPADPSRFKLGAKQGRVIAVAALVAVSGLLVFIATSRNPDFDAAPSRGVLELDTAPNPAPLTSTVTGRYRLEDVASGCVGFVDSEPVVTLRTGTPRRVQVWTETNTDLVLYTRHEDGRFDCDDDSGDSMNPLLTLDLLPGDTNVWVGTYTEDAHANFTLHIDGQMTSEAVLQVDGEASLDTLRIAGVERFVREGRTSGDTSTALASAACRGFVPSRPHIDLDVREPGSAQIVAHSTEDTVLLVRRPDGSYACDDDSGGGLDPRLVEDLQTGHYRVWVGTYAARRTTQFRLSIDVDEVATPAQDDSPRLGRWDLDAESVLSFSEQVSGRSPISTTHPECRTLFGAQSPDVELTLRQDRTVTLSLTSEGHLGMLIEHPDGTQSCDTSTRSLPSGWSAGTHRVWIGAPAPGAHIPFTLMAQTQPR